MSSGATLFWTAIAVVGIALVAPGLTRVETPHRPVIMPPSAEVTSEPPPDARAGDDLASHRLERSADGHFYAEAQVNGAPLRLLVDTGASVVALTPEDARRAGIALGPERATARGAAGDVEVVPVTVDRIAIGPLEARDVRAVVAEHLHVSLLGQSFLSRTASLEIRGDTMVLR